MDAMSIDDVIKLTKELKALGVSAFKQGELYIQFATDVNWMTEAQGAPMINRLNEDEYQ